MCKPQLKQTYQYIFLVLHMYVLILDTFIYFSTKYFNKYIFMHRYTNKYIHMFFFILDKEGDYQN